MIGNVMKDGGRQNKGVMPPGRGRMLVVLARKEAGELIGSPRGLVWLTVLAMALSAMALQFVANTELSLLGNAEAVYMMQGVVMGLAALLAVVVGNDTLAGERDRGSLVALLVAPISRDTLLLGKLGGIVVAWGLFFVLALPYLWAVGSTGQNLVAAVVSLALLGTPLVVGFGLFAIAVGARLASSLASLMTSLLVLLVAASPLVLGASLRQSVIGGTFDAINPFAAALNAFDAVVIDSHSLLSQPWRIALLLLWLAATAWFARRNVAAISG